MIVLPVDRKIQSLEIDGKVGTLVPTFFMRLYPFIALFLSTLPIHLRAQPVSAEEAITKVFKVLSGEERAVPDAKQDLLQKGAWEALAYLDQNNSFELSEESLQEAVPDYYRFKEKEMLFRLINPKDHNQFGIEGSLNYKWEKDWLVLLDRKTGLERDRWRLLYLDDQYLALEMGELRVFFTHTPPLEP